MLNMIKNDVNFSAILAVDTEVTKDLLVSKSGLPCLAENGGGSSNTGYTDIICNKNYNRKKAIFIGRYACGDHAVIPVVEGDHVINVERHWDLCKVTDFAIEKIENGKAVLRVCECVAVGTDYNGNHAFEAAIAKSLDYHCREPYYIKN